MAYQLMTRYATGLSSFKMPYGREATTSTKVGKSSYISNPSYGYAVSENSKGMDEMFSQARSKAATTREVRAAIHHERMGNRCHPPYQVGDLVWYGQRRRERHRRRGLQRWVGPFRVAAVTPGPNYLLRGIFQAIGKVLERVHTSLLKPFQVYHALLKVKLG